MFFAVLLGHMVDSISIQLTIQISISHINSIAMPAAWSLPTLASSSTASCSPPEANQAIHNHPSKRVKTSTEARLVRINSFHIFFTVAIATLHTF